MTQVPGSETSVIVSWERLNAEVITHYTVYYSQISGRKRQDNEMSIIVANTEGSVIITGLEPRTGYWFQVTATVMYLGEGERTQYNAIMLTATKTPESEGCCAGGIYNTNFNLGQLGEKSRYNCCTLQSTGSRISPAYMWTLLGGF